MHPAQLSVSKHVRSCEMEAQLECERVPRATLPLLLCNQVLQQDQGCTFNLAPGQPLGCQAPSELADQCNVWVYCSQTVLDLRVVIR